MDVSNRDRILIAGWEAGVPVREIAARTGWSPGWVSRRARALGLAARSRRLTQAEAVGAVDAYRDGRSVSEIAMALGRSVESTRAALAAAGIRILTGGERARRWPVNHYAFSAPLTTEAWYWLGFLAADGNVSRTRISLGLSPKSEAALVRFRAFLGCPEKPLRTTARGRQLLIDVHSQQMAHDLATHGVVPRKTWNLQVSRAAAAEPAFWLGNLDGDGSVITSGDAPSLGGAISLADARRARVLQRLAQRKMESGTTQLCH